MLWHLCLYIYTPHKLWWGLCFSTFQSDIQSVHQLFFFFFFFVNLHLHNISQDRHKFLICGSLPFNLLSFFFLVYSGLHNIHRTLIIKFWHDSGSPLIGLWVFVTNSTKIWAGWWKRCKFGDLWLVTDSGAKYQL